MTDYEGMEERDPLNTATGDKLIDILCCLIHFNATNLRMPLL